MIFVRCALLPGGQVHQSPGAQRPEVHDPSLETPTGAGESRQRQGKKLPCLLLLGGLRDFELALRSATSNRVIISLLHQCRLNRCSSSCIFPCSNCLLSLNLLSMVILLQTNEPDMVHRTSTNGASNVAAFPPVWVTEAATEEDRNLVVQTLAKVLKPIEKRVNLYILGCYSKRKWIFQVTGRDIELFLCRKKKGKRKLIVFLTNFLPFLMIADNFTYSSFDLRR